MTLVWVTCVEEKTEVAVVRSAPKFLVDAKDKFDAFRSRLKMGWETLLSQIDLDACCATIDDNLLGASEEWKRIEQARDAEPQAAAPADGEGGRWLKWIKRACDTQPTKAAPPADGVGGRWYDTLRRRVFDWCIHTMLPTLRVYMGVALIISALMGLYLWSYLFVTCIFDGQELERAMFSDLHPDELRAYVPEVPVEPAPAPRSMAVFLADLYDAVAGAQVRSDR